MPKQGCPFGVASCRREAAGSDRRRKPPHAVAARRRRNTAMRLQKLAFACAITAAAAQDTIQKHLVAKIEGLVDGDAFLMKTRPLTLALELLDAPAPGSLAVEVLSLIHI